MSDYKYYLEHNCGWLTRVSFGSVFHVYEEICPKCGEYIPKSNSRLGEDWDLFVGRRIKRRMSKFFWWNPLTWFDTEYILERKDDK